MRRGPCVGETRPRAAASGSRRDEAGQRGRWALSCRRSAGPGLRGRVQATEACGPRDSVVCFLCAARAAPATSAAPVCPLGHRPPRAKAPVGQLSPLGFWRTVRSFWLLTRSAHAAYQPPPFLSRPPRLPRSPPRGGGPRGFSDGQRMQVALAGLPPIAPRDSPRLLNPGRKHRRR